MAELHLRYEDGTWALMSPHRRVEFAHFAQALDAAVAWLTFVPGDEVVVHDGDGNEWLYRPKDAARITQMHPG